MPTEARKAAGARLCRVLALALFALPAWGATYYVDCSQTANGVGTETDPLNTLAGVTVGANDIFYFKPNVVCGAEKAMGSDGMIEVLNNDDNVTIGTYPATGRQCNSLTGENCAILDGENAVNIGVYVLDGDNFTLRDVWARNNLYHNFRHYGAQFQSYSIRLERVRLENAGPSGEVDGTYSTLSKGDCGFVGRTSFGNVSTTVYTDHVTVDTCSRLGFDHRWWIEAEHHNYAAFRTGYDRVIGGHGISGHPLTNTYLSSSTWTYSSGTCPGSDCVYSMPIGSAVDEEQVIWDRDVQPSRRVQRIADGNTTPPLGYFSVVSNTTIYFNFGYAPTGGANGLRVTRQPIHVDCYDCEFAFNYLRSDGNLEGSGFHADDTSPMRCFRCFSHDNEGNGFYFNASTTDYTGRSPRCESCIAINNGSDYCTGTSCGKGIYVSGGDADIVNSVAIGSLRENISVAGSHNECGELKNLSSMNAGLFGLRFQHDATSDCVPEAVYSWNDATAFSGTGAMGTVADPQFIGGPSPTTAEGVRLSASSPLAGAGTDLGDEIADYFGDLMYDGKWDIGAFRRDSCYRRSRDGNLDMARTRAQVVSRCRGIPGRYPEGL